MGKREKCPPKPSLKERRLMTIEQANDVGHLFEVLANDTRLRIIQSLAKSDELRVSEISNKLDMKPQAISNQLQKLADRKILESRRDGNQIYYRIVDPCVTSLLDLGMCLIEDSRNPEL